MKTRLTHTNMKTRLNRTNMKTRLTHTNMKTRLSFFCVGGMLVSHASAAIVLADDFQFGTGNPANVNGSVAGWTEIGTDLFGGIGTEDGTRYPTTSEWAYFQTNASSTAGMFRSTLTTGALGDAVTLTFDFGGRGNATYTGVFTVSLWDGSPTGGGTLLASLVPANPVAGIVSPVTLEHTLTGDTSGDIHVQFNAGQSGGGDFEQAIVDNVLVTLVPEPSTLILGGTGALMLLRRRRTR